jgi:hypothetical protein
MAPLGCGGLYLFLRLVAGRLIHYRLRERVYVHATIIGQSNSQNKPLWIETDPPDTPRPFGLSRRKQGGYFVICDRRDGELNVPIRNSERDVVAGTQ